MTSLSSETQQAQKRHRDLWANPPIHDIMEGLFVDVTDSVFDPHAKYPRATNAKVKEVKLSYFGIGLAVAALFIPPEMNAEWEIVDHDEAGVYWSMPRAEFLLSEFYGISPDNIEVLDLLMKSGATREDLNSHMLGFSYFEGGEYDWDFVTT